MHICGNEPAVALEREVLKACGLPTLLGHAFPSRDQAGAFVRVMERGREHGWNLKNQDLLRNVA
jgi:hypothetical protein